jgi:hypothetical protein
LAISSSFTASLSADDRVALMLAMVAGPAVRCRYLRAARCASRTSVHTARRYSRSFFAYGVPVGASRQAADALSAASWSGDLGPVLQSALVVRDDPVEHALGVAGA